MSGRLKIKVCGMKEPSNLEQVCDLAPDFVGYIFYRGSKRYVGDQPDRALFTIPGEHISRVGVFVNEPLMSVQQIMGSGAIDMVQLHGDESPAYCKALVNEGIHVIKAMDPDVVPQGVALKAYYGVVHYFLFDTPGAGTGGTGMKFNWDLLADYALPVPYLVGGGIGPGDGQSLLGLDHMWLHGVDVNSRFELSPGLKNVELLAGFISDIRKQGSHGLSSG
jgi:phosphoribosylanthranilate isomerase